MELAGYLKDNLEIETVVIPYMEAYEVALEVAQVSGAEVILRLSEFITSPDTPYANIGAVVEDGTFWIEDGLREELGVTPAYIDNAARIKSNALEEESPEIQRDEEYDLKGRNVLIVSDGISSGFREAAVAASLLKDGAENIYVAAPFASKNMMADILSVADGIFFTRKVAFVSSPDACYDKGPDIDQREGYIA